MEFLKYLDVLIGLALVMVLLSPVVTAVTQLVMWLRNRRSIFLLQAVERLIVQLEPADAAVMSVWDPSGNAVPDVSLGTLGTTDATGTLVLPTGLPAAARQSGALTLHVSAQGKVLNGYAIAIARGVAAPTAPGPAGDPPGVARAEIGADATATLAIRPVTTVITSAVAHEIARAVTAHPMVARTPAHRSLVKVPPFRNRRAEVIEREELIRILLELAAGEQACACELTPGARSTLLRALALNDVTDPAARLADIRQTAQELEQSNPELALHVRHARAIVAVPTAFVGKVTQWFDAAMARATQQYAAEARFWTVGAAFLVALALQFNAFDLLQRLSSDATLREALVTEAGAQQKRIDDLAEQARTTPTDQAAPSISAFEQARAKHQELEATLMTLRKPELSILPDHFIWEGVPQARLVRNPLWKAPYPAAFELVAGGSTYTIKPRWRRDPLIDLQKAIEASDAPVDVEFRQGPEQVAIRADEPIDLVVVPADADAELESLTDVAQAALRPKAEWPVSFDLTSRPMILEWDVRTNSLQQTRRRR